MWSVWFCHGSKRREDALFMFSAISARRAVALDTRNPATSAVYRGTRSTLHLSPGVRRREWYFGQLAGNRGQGHALSLSPLPNQGVGRRLSQRAPCSGRSLIQLHGRWADGDLADLTPLLLRLQYLYLDGLLQNLFPNALVEASAAVAVGHRQTLLRF